MATPFKVILAFQGANGTPYPIRASADDVAAHGLTWQDGTSAGLILPSGMGPLILKDVQLSGAGADTTYMDIYVNGRIQPVQVQNALNLASNLARQFITSPVAFPPGASVMFIQRA